MKLARYFIAAVALLVVVGVSVYYPRIREGFQTTDATTAKQVDMGGIPSFVWWIIFALVVVLVIVSIYTKIVWATAGAGAVYKGVTGAVGFGSNYLATRRYEANRRYGAPAAPNSKNNA